MPTVTQLKHDTKIQFKLDVTFHQSITSTLESGPYCTLQNLQTRNSS